MWVLSLPWWEYIVRGAVVYVFLILILRLTGKRQIGQMSPFDLVLLLVLSNAVQNSMNGGDNSITAGMILALTLVTLNWCTGFLTYKSKIAERLIEGSPQLLLHNGKIHEKALADAQLTREELMSSLRAEGYTDVSSVRAAILENDGSVSVIPYHLAS
ncbi:MAG: YetF domain-containing protein [Verrucomicrobiota bacterium]